MNYLKVPFIILIVCFNISVYAQQTLIFTQKDRWYREGIELLQREKVQLGKACL
jgi:hypothetical protein